MRPIRIVILGFDEIGLAVAEESTARDDMVVVGVVEGDGRRSALARSIGFEVLAGDAIHAADVVVGRPPRCRWHGVWGPESPAGDRIRLPGAEEVALRGLLGALGGPATCRRIACLSAGIHDDFCAAGPADRLEPVFASDSSALGRALGLGGRLSLHRVHVPGGGTRLFFIEINLARSMMEQELLKILDEAEGIVVLNVPNTGLVNEHFRDRGRPRGRHHEICVIRDSLCVDGHFVRLMAEVDPVGVRVPGAQASIRRLFGSPQEAAGGKEGA